MERQDDELIVGLNSRRPTNSGRQEAEGPFPTLPQELVVDILSRLPVKSLCRFRCVSKSWLFLISSTRFAKTHLDLGLQNKEVESSRRRLIISSHNLYSVEYRSVCSCSDDSSDIRVVELDYPLKYKPYGWHSSLGYNEDEKFYFRLSEDEDDNPVMVKVNATSSMSLRNWVDVVGSCNGIVCIAPDENMLFLFNPSTGESKRIAEEHNSGLEAADGICSYGFGYVSTSDDYKVVRIDDGSIVSIYSLRTDSWRRLGNFPYDNSVFESGLLLNGFVHWALNSRECENPKHLVVCFDLEKEMFQEMLAPDIDDTSSDIWMGTLGGKLCALYSRNDMQNDVWIMQEYGVAESWTMIVISLPFFRMKPLCLTEREKALLMVDGRLFLYDFGIGTYKFLEVHGVPFGDVYEVDIFVESLISPNHYFEAET
ncbi:hypothetical protein K2173_017626 [Erythroxylum novogranatense]|uniref:F-box domain-containing protein n=1 Tax=Erythroxylum novogranatense TaxID=1862640 RepID=A0AAV8TKU8_9ROSI|nr:hypothetical protein K2173_017626 [Erythroxylum novogranatense]